MVSTVLLNDTTDDPELTAQEVADYLDIDVRSWRTYVSRDDTVPRPHRRIFNHPVWRLSAIKAWDEARPGLGSGGGRPVGS